MTRAWSQGYIQRCKGSLKMYLTGHIAALSDTSLFLGERGNECWVGHLQRQLHRSCNCLEGLTKCYQFHLLVSSHEVWSRSDFAICLHKQAFSSLLHRWRDQTNRHDFFQFLWIKNWSETFILSCGNHNYMWKWKKVRGASKERKTVATESFKMTTLFLHVTVSSYQNE